VFNNIQEVFILQHITNGSFVLADNHRTDQETIHIKLLIATSVVLDLVGTLYIYIKLTELKLNIIGIAILETAALTAAKTLICNLKRLYVRFMLLHLKAYCPPIVS
jgi:hypothetical protein